MGLWKLLEVKLNDFEVKKIELNAVLQKDMIRGAVIYIDIMEMPSQISTERIRKNKKGR